MLPYFSLECKNLIPHTSNTILTESHTFLGNGIFYTFLIRVQYRFSTLELEKDNLSERSFWESIKDDIIRTFSDEYHILWCIGKIRKRRKDFLIYFSRDTIARTSDSIALEGFLLREKKNLRKKKTKE